MMLWLLLISVFNLQGYCLGVQTNGTRILDHVSTQYSPIKTSPSTIPYDTNSELRSPQRVGNSPVISSTLKYIRSTSNPMNGIKDTVTPSQISTNPTPRAITTTIKTTVDGIAMEGSNASKRAEIKTKSVISIPADTSIFLSTSKKPSGITAVHPPTEATFHDGEVFESHRLSEKTATPKTNGTRFIQAHTNKPADHAVTEGTSTNVTPRISQTEFPIESSTSTPVETYKEEETSTLALNETGNWYYEETNETTIVNVKDDNFSYATTDVYIDDTTPDLPTERIVEDSKTKISSTPNGISARENQPIPGISSPLTKLILKLSKPGVFEKGKSVFDDDPSAMTTSCPPGDSGLPCRRAEARRTADECSGGNCEVCRSCNNMAALDWPHCCRENFRCCSELALACQRCDQPTLKVFCTKHFKRCF